LYSTAEIEYIFHQASPILAYWKMWACKESAYKSWQRLVDAKPVFNPIAFECKPVSESEYLVAKRNFNFNVSIQARPDYIYASINSDDKFSSFIFTSIKDYKQYLKLCEEKGWYLNKNQNGLPFFYHKTSGENRAISLSHDMNWYALQWINKRSSTFQES
jgi:phosphopantetheinyl transferase (holo-ACP synthase)